MERYNRLYKCEKYNNTLNNRMRFWKVISSKANKNDQLAFLPPENRSTILSLEEMGEYLVKIHLRKKVKLVSIVFNVAFSKEDYRKLYDEAWSVITKDSIPNIEWLLSDLTMGALTPLDVVNAISWESTLDFLKV